MFTYVSRRQFFLIIALGVFTVAALCNFYFFPREFSIKGNATGALDLLIFWGLVIVIAFLVVVSLWPTFMPMGETAMPGITAWTRTKLSPSEAKLLSEWQVLSLTKEKIDEVEATVVTLKSEKATAQAAYEREISDLKLNVTRLETEKAGEKAAFERLMRAGASHLYLAAGYNTGNLPADMTIVEGGNFLAEVRLRERIEMDTLRKEMSAIRNAIGAITGNVPADNTELTLQLQEIHLYFDAVNLGIKEVIPTPEWESSFDTWAGRFGKVKKFNTSIVLLKSPPLQPEAPQPPADTTEPAADANQPQTPEQEQSPQA